MLKIRNEKTLPVFKSSVAKFIMKKTLNDSDAFFVVQSYLKNKKIPANMRFKEYQSNLELISLYLFWLLDENQMIQYKSIRDPLKYTRRSRANNMLWRFDPTQEHVCGSLTELEEIEIILGAIPESWNIRFEEQGGNHQMPFQEVIKKIN